MWTDARVFFCLKTSFVFFSRIAWYTGNNKCTRQQSEGYAACSKSHLSIMILPSLVTRETWELHNGSSKFSSNLVFPNLFCSFLALRYNCSQRFQEKWKCFGPHKSLGGCEKRHTFLPIFFPRLFHFAQTILVNFFPGKIPDNFFFFFFFFRLKKHGHKRQETSYNHVKQWEIIFSPLGGGLSSSSFPSMPTTMMMTTCAMTQISCFARRLRPLKKYNPWYSVHCIFPDFSRQLFIFSPHFSRLFFPLTFPWLKKVCSNFQVFQTSTALCEFSLSQLIDHWHGHSNCHVVSQVFFPFFGGGDAQFVFYFIYCIRAEGLHHQFWPVHPPPPTNSTPPDANEESVKTAPRMCHLPPLQSHGRPLAPSDCHGMSIWRRCTGCHLYPYIEETGISKITHSKCQLWTHAKIMTRKAGPPRY